MPSYPKPTSNWEINSFNKLSWSTVLVSALLTGSCTSANQDGELSQISVGSRDKIAIEFSMGNVTDHGTTLGRLPDDYRQSVRQLATLVWNVGPGQKNCRPFPDSSSTDLEMHKSWQVRRSFFPTNCLTPEALKLVSLISCVRVTCPSSPQLLPPLTIWETDPEMAKKLFGPRPKGRSD